MYCDTKSLPQRDRKATTVLPTLAAFHSCCIVGRPEL